MRRYRRLRHRVPTRGTSKGGMDNVHSRVNRCSEYQVASSTIMLTDKNMQLRFISERVFVKSRYRDLTNRLSEMRFAQCSVENFCCHTSQCEGPILTPPHIPICPEVCRLPLSHGSKWSTYEV